MSKVEHGSCCLSVFLLLGSEMGIGMQIITGIYWKSRPLVETGDLQKISRGTYVGEK